MSNRVIKVAVTQAEPEWLDLPSSVNKTCEYIGRAAENGARIVAFPECWIPGYPGWIWSVFPFDRPLVTERERGERRKCDGRHT